MKILIGPSCNCDSLPDSCSACCRVFITSVETKEAIERLMVIGNRIQRESVPAQFMADGATLNPQWSARQRILQVYVKGHSQKAWGI